jgi:hypothetical protein
MRTRTLWLMALAALPIVGAACDRPEDIEPGSGGAEEVEGAATTTAGSDTTLDFESTSSWTASGGSRSSTTTRTHGAKAVTFNKTARDAHVVSIKIGHTAKALSGLGDAGSSFAIDVAPPAGTSPTGDIRLRMSCPSRGINNVDLGRASLTGARPGFFQTLKFAIPNNVRTALGGKSYSDLTFDISVNVGSSTAGTYRLDHLRVQSHGADPNLGAAKSADLVAQRTYRPSLIEVGQADFPAAVAQVPQSFPVKLGKAGTGDASLELGYAGTPAVTCSYKGDGAMSFVLASCTNGVKAGDIVGADYAKLIVNGGDPTAGPTKVKAQIVLNPAGDVAGPNVIPPLPTFWGSNGTEASKIVTDFFNAANKNPATEERWIKAPAPTWAKRNGDGSPNDNLVGVAPPPNDPPFDQEGHLNAGSDWDAYWRLNGNLTTESANNRARTHLEATFGAHAVVWGSDKEVAKVHTVVDTDQGEVQQDGFRQPTATGSLEVFLMGSQIFQKSASPQDGFDVKFNREQNFNLPPIGIWIFSIQLGLNTSVGLEAKGTISFAGMAFNFTPSASAGVHIFGGVNIGVASGGIDAVIDLLKISAPVNASALWRVTTSPDECGGFIDLDLHASVKLSTLGGHVNLVAELGICPFCYHDSWEIFSWDPIDLGEKKLFQFNQTGKIFSLPGSLCLAPLEVHITAPPTDPHPIAGIPVQAGGNARRPATAGSASFAVPCSGLVWTDPPMTGNTTIGTGCTPVLNLALAGWHKLVLTATDSFGETGTAEQWILVDDPPVALTAQIVTPVEGQQFFRGPPPEGMLIQGAAAGGSGQYTMRWGASNGFKSVDLGSGPTVRWFPPAPDIGQWTITLTVNDGVSTATSQVHVVFFDIR